MAEPSRKINLNSLTAKGCGSPQQRKPGNDIVNGELVGLPSVQKPFCNKMQSRMACIERQMDGTAEAGLSQAKCKNTLKMVTDRLNNKLRVLAASAGYPVPKKMQLPRRLAMYEHLINIAKGNNYEDTDKSVIGKTKLSSSSDLCVAIDVCSESQHKKLVKYWSAQLYRGKNMDISRKKGRLCFLRFQW